MPYIRKIVTPDYGAISFEFGLIKCKDGFEFSVHAREENYCSPRDDNGPYIEVEVGFPSKAEPLFFPFMEFKTIWTDDGGLRDKTQIELIETATDQVYPWTPVSIVLQVIKKHGGRE